VTASTEGIHFVLYDEENHNFDIHSVESFLNEFNVYSIEEYAPDYFLLALRDKNGYLLIFDRKTN